MAIACPVDLDTRKLREEIESIYGGSHETPRASSTSIAVPITQPSSSDMTARHSWSCPQRHPLADRRGLDQDLGRGPLPEVLHQPLPLRPHPPLHQLAPPPS